MSKIATVKELTCRLCLAVILKKQFKVVDEFTRAVLDIPLLMLKNEDNNNHIVCNICYERLNAAVGFKLICLNTNKTIISHVEYHKILQVDLGEVYVKEKGSKLLTDITHDQKVCCLCMQLVANQFRSVCDEELEAIRIFLPEIDITIVNDPAICIKCFDSLRTHNDFIGDYSEVLKKIGGVCVDEATCSQDEACSFDFLIKTENLEEIKTNEKGITIKTECDMVKSEEDEERSDVFGHEPAKDTENVALVDDSQCQDADHAPTCNYEKINFTTHYIRNEASELQEKNDKNLLSTRPGACNACGYKTTSEKKFEEHLSRHAKQSIVRVFKCNVCAFETRHIGMLPRHASKHKTVRTVTTNAPKGRAFQCDLCSYSSKYKSSIVKHELKHKSPSETQMYKCNDCDYETRYKNNLATHVLGHMKSIPETWMHGCDECEYRTRKKSHLLTHKLRHKSPAEIQMYRCKVCSYQTKYKGTLFNHQLTHKTFAERLEHKASVKKKSRRQYVSYTVPESVLRVSMKQRMRAILNVAK